MRGVLVRPWGIYETATTSLHSQPRLASSFLCSMNADDSRHPALLTEAYSTPGRSGRITALAGPGDHHTPDDLRQGEVLVATAQRTCGAIRSLLVLAAKRRREVGYSARLLIRVCNQPVAVFRSAKFAEIPAIDAVYFCAGETTNFDSIESEERVSQPIPKTDAVPRSTSIRTRGLMLLH
jgi:hypothetical protein